MEFNIERPFLVKALLDTPYRPLLKNLPFIEKIPLRNFMS